MGEGEHEMVLLGYAHRESQFRYSMDNPLFEAIALQDTDRVQHLIRTKPELINYTEGSPKGVYPIHACATKGRVDYIDLLVQHGADIHKKTKSQKNVLHFAVFKGLYPCTKALIERGVECNVVSDKSFTPLMQACINADASMVHLLLDSCSTWDLTLACARGNPYRLAMSSFPLVGRDLESIIRRFIRMGLVIKPGEISIFTPWVRTLQQEYQDEVVLPRRRAMIVLCAMSERYNSLVFMHIMPYVLEYV